jgi:TonB family protein
MNVRLSILVSATAVSVAIAQLPAPAQYSSEFVPAKLIQQGKTSTSIAGNGTVVVQVQVNADGTHKAIKVLHSSNSGDNAAAMEIAQSSTYRPAHRGGTAVTSFYDFTLKFKGKLVVNADEGGGAVPTSGGAMSPAATQVAALIRKRDYAAAKSKAQAELLNSPSDDSLREMLGIAAYQSDDFTTAAAAFDKVNSIGKQYQPIAADSLAIAAARTAQQNPTQALAYAQKATSLGSGTVVRYGLGVAQLANNQNAEALATLKQAQSEAMSDPKIPVAFKVNVDSTLLQAYLANNDTAGAQAVAAQIKQLDPSSTAGSAAMGVSLIKSARTARDANDTAKALSYYDQAAALGDPTVAVTADTEAALTIGQSSKPDYKRMQAYAEKALAIKPNDALANFAEGIALTGQSEKQKASDALQKADQQAKADGNEALSLQIETFVKKYINGAPSAQPGGGS